MRPLRTSTLIVLSIAATALFYGALAALLGWNEGWLRSTAGVDASLVDRLAVPVQRAARDLAMFLGCGLAICLAYAILSRGPFAARGVSEQRIPRGQITREFLLMGNAILATGIIAALYIVLTELGYARTYPDIGRYGWPYAIFTGALFFVLSDAWSYLVHRLYHENDLLFGASHRVHHLSVVTTPWTTLQGSPFDLVPSLFFVTFLVTTIPIATPVFLFVTVASAFQQMIAHGGLEVFPRGTATHWLGRWIVTPTYHQMHHELLDRNFGLYFTWWDRLFGTKSADYERRFAAVTSSAAQRPVLSQPGTGPRSRLSRSGS